MVIFPCFGLAGLVIKVSRGLSIQNMLETEAFKCVDSHTGSCLMPILYLETVEVKEHRLRRHEFNKEVKNEQNKWIRLSGFMNSSAFF